VALAFAPETSRVSLQDERPDVRAAR
jgi:hypothetical protein